MRMSEYVKNWLVGAGRADLARKVDRGELPELATDEAHDLFRSFQRGTAQPADFLEEIIGIEARAETDTSGPSR